MGWHAFVQEDSWAWVRALISLTVPAHLQIRGVHQKIQRKSFFIYTVSWCFGVKKLSFYLLSVVICYISLVWN